MICNKCGKTTREGRFCEHCGNALGTSATNGGMATLRIHARKHQTAWLMVLQPVTIFIGYKVYISVDDQEYVLKSKKGQIDISVVPGVHNVRISAYSKKQMKAMSIIGFITQLFGAVNASSYTYVAGSIIEDVGRAMSKDGLNIRFEPGEFMEVKVKQNFLGNIVEDK